MVSLKITLIFLIFIFFVSCLIVGERVIYIKKQKLNDSRLWKQRADDGGWGIKINHSSRVTIGYTVAECLMHSKQKELEANSVSIYGPVPFVLGLLIAVLSIVIMIAGNI